MKRADTSAIFAEIWRSHIDLVVAGHDPAELKERVARLSSASPRLAREWVVSRAVRAMVRGNNRWAVAAIRYLLTVGFLTIDGLDTDEAILQWLSQDND